MMSAPATTDTNQPHSEMHGYVPPHYPPPPVDGRSRASSAASKYTPDGYRIPPKADKTEIMAYLAPEDQRAPLAQAGGPFTPSNPDQYRPSPAAMSGAVPPAQLPVNYQDNRHLTSDGYDRSGSSHRRASATSHYSERSRRSSHSHSHHEPDRHRHSHESDRHRHSGEHHHHHEHEHKHRHFEGDNDKYLADDRNLTRKNTPRRSYGGSLFALFDTVKEALKGN